MAIFITEFALRHFGGGKKTKKIQIPCSPEDFASFSNSCYNPEKLVNGYAPFCKHLYIPNKWGILNNILPLTSDLLPHVRSGYIRRTPAELPVLTRWLPREVGESLMKPSKFIDVILYSSEQCKKEGENVPDGGMWGVVGLIPCDEEVEYPMAPITAMRNALGIAEGGSGVPIDREAYEKSVAFWDTHIAVEDGE